MGQVDDREASGLLNRPTTTQSRPQTATARNQTGDPGRQAVFQEAIKGVQNAQDKARAAEDGDWIPG